jgi:hypothetical protein
MSANLVSRKVVEHRHSVTKQEHWDQLGQRPKAPHAARARAGRPLSQSRRISFTATEGLTSNRPLDPSNFVSVSLDINYERPSEWSITLIAIR